MSDIKKEIEEFIQNNTVTDYSTDYGISFRLNDIYICLNPCKPICGGHDFEMYQLQIKYDINEDYQTLVSFYTYINNNITDIYSMMFHKYMIRLKNISRCYIYAYCIDKMLKYYFENK